MMASSSAPGPANGPSRLAATSAPIVVDARAVTKTFGSGSLAYQALRGVDFSVRQNEFVMLCGPSGSGKTTLLSILGCVLTATSGEVDLFGVQLVGRKERELAKLRAALIGFIFQGHNLIASLSAEDNVAMVARLRGTPKAKARAEARELLERVGLSDKRKNRPDQLSGGQRQRVAVARAVAGNPPLVLADEPTAALDAHAGLEVTELLHEICREHGATVVVVTHDNRIFHLADRIVNIEDGAIVESPV